jgi:hypothetical protein
MSLKKINEGINNFEYNSFAGDNADKNFYGAFHASPVTRDPKITGYAFIKWLRVPSWVLQEYPSFENMTERNLRAFTGLTDIDLTTTSIQEGFSASEIQFAGGVANFQGFSVTHREWQGSPIKNMYTHWVSGIRDPLTNVATYPKRYSQAYSAANHTGELLYITTTPDADNYGAGGQIIESATLYLMAMPTRMPLGGDNFTAGSNDVVETEIPFTGVPIYGAEVNKLAVSILPKLYPMKHMGEFASGNELS